MKNILILCATLLVLLLSSCEKEACGTLYFLNGTWEEYQFPVNNTAVDTAYRTFNADLAQSIYTRLPQNQFGFEEGEICLKDIVVIDHNTFEAKGLSKKLGTFEIEWLDTTIEIVDNNTITIDYRCPNCVDDVDITAYRIQ